MSSTLSLRPYQQEAVSAVLSDMKSGKPSHGLIVLGTGAGKSHVIAGIVEQYKGPVIVLQPTKELLLQNQNKFQLTGLESSVYSASFGKADIGHVTFATLGSILKEAAHLSTIKNLLILCDEAHYKYDPQAGSQIKRFLDKVKPRFLYGLTATPFRLYAGNSMGSGSILKMINRTRPKLFNKILYVQQIAEIIELGFWSPSVDERWHYDSTELQLNTTGSEYTDQSVKRANEANSVNRSIAVRVHELLKGRHRKSILVFTDCVETARILSDHFDKHTKAGYVTGDTPKKERDKTVRDFLDGKIKVLFNYGIFSLGFDFPGLDCIVMGRPTNSLAVLYQIYGRGVRVLEGKEDFLFIDCCDNFGNLCHPRELTVEDHPIGGWSIFAGEKLITNVPLGGPPVYRKDLTENHTTELQNLSTETMPFGRWKGRLIMDMCRLDRGYAEYMLTLIDPSRYGPRLKNIIEAALKQTAIQLIIAE